MKITVPGGNSNVVGNKEINEIYDGFQDGNRVIILSY